MSRPRVQRSGRRTALLVSGTAASLVLVLGYRTPPNSLGAVSVLPKGHTSSAPATSGGGRGQAGSGGSRSLGGANTRESSPAPANRTATGQVVYTRYGPVQVQVAATGTRVTDVRAIALPDGDAHSAEISRYAGPRLRLQAMSAQSAQIDGVAGASYTSQGYRESLQSALNQLGG